MCVTDTTEEDIGNNRVRWFLLHRRVPVKAVVDGVPYMVEASKFKECDRVVDSDRMIRMSDR